jgi:hypothetical protein
VEMMKMKYPRSAPRLESGLIDRAEGRRASGPPRGGF